MAMGRPRSFDTDQALDRAVEVFWRKGYEGASLAELTRAMGINPPSLYAAFGNKEGLFRAALDRYVSQRTSYMETVLGAPTAREVAERVLLGTCDRPPETNEPRGCLLLMGGLACGAGAEGIPAELADRRQQNEALFRARFERAATDGDLAPGASPAGLARYLATVLQGMGVQAAAGATYEELREVARLALAAFPAPASGAGADVRPVAAE